MGHQLMGIMKKTRLMKILPVEHLSCITMANLRAHMRMQTLVAANGFAAVIRATSGTAPPVMPDLMAVQCMYKELVFKMKNKNQQLSISKSVVYKN